MQYSRNKRKRDELAQWYSKNLKSLSLGDSVAKTAIFKIDGRYIHVDIPMDEWRKAITDHTDMRKLRVAVMDIAVCQSEETKS